MEIFTYLRMGGEVDHIEVNMIASPDKDHGEAQQELMAQFAGFDAGKAQCFKGELHCSVNGVVNGAVSLAVWPASSLACSLVLCGR